MITIRIVSSFARATILADWIGLLFFLWTNTACHQLHTSGPLTQVKDNASPPVTPGSGDSDLPPIGHSVFDYVVQSSNGVPFPFESLLDGLFTTHRSRQIPVALFPYGRSLQRYATDLQHPRIVAVPDVLFGPAACDSSVPIGSSQIFIAYAENANSLEVISYNEAAGRMEFEVVKDYGPGLTPKVYYEPRALCTACHQGGSPLFSIFPWSESNIPFAPTGTADVTAALAQANPNVSQYHEVYFREPQNQTGTERTGVNQPAVDRATRNTSRLIFDQSLWRDSCGSGADIKYQCHSLMAKLATGAIFNVQPDSVLHVNSSDPLYLSLQGLWSTHWPASGIPFISSKLSDRHPATVNDLLPKVPLQPQEDPLSSRILPHAVQPTDVSSGDFGGDVEAFQGLESEDASSPNLVILALSLNVFSPYKASLLGASGNDQAKLFQAIDSAIVKPFLQADHFERTAFVNAILQALGAAQIPPECYASDTSLPNPQLLNGSQSLTSDGNSAHEAVLTLMKSYCAPCHTNTGSPELDFMQADNDADLWSQVYGNVAIKTRINWEAGLPQSQQMPPAGSPQGQKLRSTAFSSDRILILVGLQ